MFDEHPAPDAGTTPIASKSPPGPEEIDDCICAHPWILRKRLTREAYATRCRQDGREFSGKEWSDHLSLTDDELQLLNDMIETQRDSHCFEIGPKFVIREYGNKARVGWFDDRSELVTMTFAEFRNAHIDRTVDAGLDKDGKPITIPLATYWLKHPLTRRYDRVEFVPGVEQDDMPEGVLNLWRGWPMGLIPGWAETRIGPDGAVPSRKTIFDASEMPPQYCDMFLDHILNNMCSGDAKVMEYLLGWMADALWNPGPCDTAVILQGPQGSGKTFWAERFMEFFGAHALTLDQEDQVVGKFNKHLMNKSVIFADEAFFAGNRGHAAKLKTLISRPDLFIEPKGVDGFTVPKLFRLIMASNDDHIIRAERDDRRNLVLKVDAGVHNQDRDYFARMHEEWQTGGRQALFRWLTGAHWGEAVGNGKFRKWRRPVTAALQEQKELSLPAAQMVVNNILREGEVPCDFATDTRAGTVFVATQLLADARHLTEADLRSLGDALRVLAEPGQGSVRAYVGVGRDRRQHRGFWLPSLVECRRRWERHLGQGIAWPADVQSWAIEAVPTREDDADEPF